MRIICLTFIILFAMDANAQKLPSIQKGNVYAPNNVKIDGKASEWGIIKAYNNATSVFYTIANDNKKLYLIVQATDRKIITKIINGGVSFSVSRQKTLGPDAVTINYPLPDEAKLSRGQDENTGKLLTISKAGQFDTLSIYNNLGIRIASAIGDQETYTYELAVEMKYFVSLIKEEKFFYNIKLNGLKNILGTIFETAADGSQAIIVTDAKLAMQFLNLSVRLTFGANINWSGRSDFAVGDRTYG